MRDAERPRRPRRWVVDGMNLIGSRPDGWWRDRRGAMRRLVEQLNRLGENTGDGMTVVFDGRPFAVETSGEHSPRVVFAARSGRDAGDDRIVELVAQDAGRSDLTVVTSDRGLAARVRALGAGVVGTGEFKRRLESGSG